MSVLRERMSGGELVVRGLAAHGVHDVFGIPGTHNLELYRHLAHYGLHHTTVRHEQGAGYAADGFARASGRIGVVITTSGPAVLNAAAAIGQANSDSVPLLVIAPGQPTTHVPGSGTLHEARDQFGAIGAIAKAAFRATSAGHLPELVEESFVVALSGRPGPVYLELPHDLLAQVEDLELRPMLQLATLDAHWPQVQEAAGLLSNAERPLILLGGGARWAGAEAVRVAESLDAPLLTTINGKGAVPEDHRLSLGAALHVPAATDLFAQSDVVLAVGTELAETDWWSGLPTTGILIRVDIEPTQLLRNAHAEVALHGDARRVLEELGTEVVARKHRPEYVEHWRGRIQADVVAEGAPWRAVLNELRAGLERDAVVVADTAMAAYYGAIGNLPVYTPGSFCYPTGFGTLGYALPAAIGAAVGCPGRQVVALSGDGGLMFSAPELATAAAAGIPLPVVVFANGGYGEIRNQMVAAGIDPIAVDLPEPDFAGLARSMGGHGEEFTVDALRRALTRKGPTVLVVRED